MARTKKGFDDGLALISLFGFLAIALASFSEVNLAPYQTAVLMIIAGGALLLEGQIMTIKQWGRNGIQGNEVPLLMTLIIGMFTLIAGIMSLPQIPEITFLTPHMTTVIGLISVFAFGFIALQRWVWN